MLKNIKYKKNHFNIFSIKKILKKTCALQYEKHT